MLSFASLRSRLLSMQLYVFFLLLVKAYENALLFFVQGPAITSKVFFDIEIGGKVSVFARLVDDSTHFSIRLLVEL